MAARRYLHGLAVVAGMLAVAAGMLGAGALRSPAGASPTDTPPGAATPADSSSTPNAAASSTSNSTSTESSSSDLQRAAGSTSVAPPDSTAIPRATVEVVGTPVAVVRGGPGPQHAITATLHEGDRLTIDARAGEWYHLELRDGRSGWVHESLLRTWVDPRKFEFVPDPGRPSRMRTFHLVAYGGAYAADREDNGILAGARIGYSITSRFAFEAGIGWTTVTRTTYVIEQIYGLRLEEEHFNLFFYEAGGSMEVLPNRRVSPFVSAAVGASVLNSRVEPTWALGVGTKLFLTKRLGARWELRDHHLHGGNQFTRFAGDNLEFSGGLEMLF